MKSLKDDKPRLFYTLRGMSDRILSAEVSKQQLAANVRRIREARGLTQDELAEKVGLSRSAMGAIERAEVDTAFSTAVAIADVLGVSVSVLAGEHAETDDEATREERTLLQKFRRISVQARQAILLAALAYPDVVEDSPGEHRSPPDPPGTSRRTR